MPGFLYEVNGERVYVREGEAPPSGATLVGDQTATYTDSSGELKTVAAEDYLGAVSTQAGNFSRPQMAGAATQQALEDDYWKEQTYDTLGNEIAAGAAGLARGATLGLSDAALTGLDIVDREDLEGIRDVNPGVSLAGEIAGSFAGVGKLGAIGKLTPAGAVNRLGARMASKGGLTAAVGSAATEGALFGAGQGVSNLALSDKPLTAEAVATEIGLNTIYGAGLGGVFGAAGHGLAKAGSKLAQRGDDKLASMYADDVSEALEGAREPLSKVFQEADDLGAAVSTKLGARRGAAKEMYDISTIKNIDSAFTKRIEQAQEVVAKYGVEGTEGALAKLGQKQADFFETLKKQGILDGDTIDWQKLHTLDDAGQKAFQKSWDEYGESVANYTKKAQVEPISSTADDVKTAAKGADKGAKTGREETLIDTIRSQPIRKVMEPVDEGAAALGKELQEAQAAYKKAVPDLDTFIAKEPDEALKALTTYDDYLKKLKQAAPDEELAARAVANQEEVKRIVDTVLKKEDGAVTDLAKMAAIFGVEEAVLPDIGGPIGTLMELYIAHRAVRGLGKGKAAGKLGKMMRSAAGSAGRRAAGFGATGGAIVGQEIKRQTYGKAAERAFDFFSGGLNKMGNTVGRASATLQKNLGRATKGVGKATKRSTPAATAIMNASFGPSEGARKPKNAQQAFEARSRELSQAVANLPAFQERIHNNLANVRSVNIEVGDHMAMHAARAAQFLHEKMPKDPGTLQHFGKSRWKPTERQLEKWGRYVRAVNEGPEKISERFASGRMTREDAEALKVVYPAHFAKVQQWMVDNIQTIQEKVPYERRIQWSVMMGVTGDPVMQRVDKWQAYHAEKPVESPQMQMQNQQTPTMAQQLTGAPGDV